MGIITLTTDFGTRDPYVGVMKGVIAQIAPATQVVDITHEIEGQQIMAAAFVLRQTIAWFPRGTVHVAVVDPGVGSARRILAAQYAGQIVLVPDNGLITLVHRDFRLEDARSVEERRYMLPSLSTTFHGRDIFAPVAAHLSTGLPLARVGPFAAELATLNMMRPAIAEDHVISGQIVYVDRFGNLVSNIARGELLTTYKHRRGVQVFLNEHCLGPIRGSYHEAPAGTPLALIGSTELVEVAVNCGSAAEHFQLGVGAAIVLR